MTCRGLGPGPYPSASHADSTLKKTLALLLGVAKAVLFTPSLEAQNLPRPSRNHKKSLRLFRWKGATFQVSEATWEKCIAANAKPTEFLLANKETLETLDRMAAKAKGSN